METLGLGLGLDWGGAMVHMETSCGVILGILDGVWVLPPLAPRLPCLPLTASYSQGQGQGWGQG